MTLHYSDIEPEGRSEIAGTGSSYQLEKNGEQDQ